MSLSPHINIVVPLYNESESFTILTERLTRVLQASAYSIEVILVDDGSTDSTAEMMKELSLKDTRFQSVFLSRNFGQQSALDTGLRFINATEAILIIDGDLQDPPELLDPFYKKLKEGYDVVYAIREHRSASIVLKVGYWLFYRIMKKFSYVDIPLDSGNFSLISRRVADQINNLPEEGRFFRGMRSWVGYRQIGIPFSREERIKGDSKYNYRRLISLSLNGIFNFSKYPIRFTMTLGIIAMFASIVYFVFTLIKKFFVGDVPLGFTALLFAIILFGGLQLIAIGIIGEYILRIFFQVKNRPNFVVKERIQNGHNINE